MLLRNGLAFCGSDESEESLYRGNFLDTFQWYGEFCPEVEKIILRNAPKNNQLTSSGIQKDIVSTCAGETTAIIIKEVGGRGFAILVDGDRDSSVNEQIVFVLRYVNNLGEVVE